jgi:hypothetical protein
MRDRKHADMNGVETGASRGAGDGVRRLLHDFNQPLTAIGNYAQAGSQLIDKGLSDTARLKELFEKIALQCGRTNTLSQELRKAVSELLPGEELS